MANGLPGRYARWPLPFPAVVAIACADLSYSNEAGAEWIWLPFGIWLMPGAGLTPAGSRRR